MVNTIRLVKEFALPRPGLITVAEACRDMGQRLLDPPTVEGWHTGQEWIDSGTLLQRVNFCADQLGDISKAGVREMAQRISAKGSALTPEALVDCCVEQVGGVPLTDDTRKEFTHYAAQGGPVETGAEQFTRRTASMFRLIACSKEYQFG